MREARVSVEHSHTQTHVEVDIGGKAYGPQRRRKISHAQILRGTKQLPDFVPVAFLRRAMILSKRLSIAASTRHLASLLLQPQRGHNLSMRHNLSVAPPAEIPAVAST